MPLRNWRSRRRVTKPFFQSLATFPGECWNITAMCGFRRNVMRWMDWSRSQNDRRSNTQDEEDALSQNLRHKPRHKTACRRPTLPASYSKFNGRDRDRTDDLYRVKVALIPTELRAREQKRRLNDCKVARGRFQHLHGFARAAYRTGLAQEPPESGYDVAGAIR